MNFCPTLSWLRTLEGCRRVAPLYQDKEVKKESRLVERNTFQGFVPKYLAIAGIRIRQSRGRLQELGS